VQAKLISYRNVTHWHFPLICRGGNRRWKRHLFNMWNSIWPILSVWCWKRSPKN